VVDVPAKWHHETAAQLAGHALVAGIDEAGRGPWAGPVVAAAVILTDTDFAVRIDDSKRLSARQRDRAYDAIMTQAHVGVGITSESTIDALNIVQATCVAMREAIAHVGVQPQYILVDGIIPQLTDITQQSIIHGEDASLSIACASIVAKVTRDRLMIQYDQQFPQYGFAKHKGYGTAAHRSSLQTYGPSPIHRRSFRPVAACIS
jgi:ribonuclease HII